MAKKQSGKKTRREEKPRSSWRKRLLRFTLTRLLPPVIIIALIIIFRDAIIAWTDKVANGTFALLGWGLLLIVLALAVLAGFIWRCGKSWLWRRANRWLGAVSAILAIWGIMAFVPATVNSTEVTSGGYTGQAIIGHQDIIGVFRVLGLIVLSLVLLMPGPSYRLLKRFFIWLWQQLFRKKRATLTGIPSPAAGRALPRKTQTARKVPPEPAPMTAEDFIEEEAGETEEYDEEPAADGEESRPGKKALNGARKLKDAAREVWKKYGESPALVTVDGWKLPAVDILDAKPEAEYSHADNMERAKKIEEALASYGVETKVVQINTGPTVTQFGVEPGWDRKYKDIKEKDKDGNVHVRQEEIAKTRVKVDRITSLANDLALALAAPSIRIEAPVPGKSIVGVEVPNTISSTVSLRSVIETNVYQKLNAKSKLALALGKGAGGEAIVGDLGKMPHLLIAGATGSGKTVCLNTIVCCLLTHNTPYDVRFIMIDPKRVELTPYNSVPHLATPVIVDTQKALGTLRWLAQEMDRRYQVLAASRVRNIDAYNKNRHGPDKLPYLVLVVDELADLMMTSGEEVEHILCRLAQLARATGIHLVVATQRPSVDVITGLIKANFPSRISFAVTSQVDSRTILDTVGAEKLLGSGDMLYLPTEAGKPKRLQGCYVSDAETEHLVYFWGSQRQEQGTQLKLTEMLVTPIMAEDQGFPEDPMMDKARELAEQHDQHISTSYLQRHLRIGYPRAARIMEQIQMEREDMMRVEGGEDGGKEN